MCNFYSVVKYNCKNIAILLFPFLQYSAQYANFLYIHRIPKCALCTGYCISHHTQLDFLVPV